MPTLEFEASISTMNCCGSYDRCSGLLSEQVKGRVCFFGAGEGHKVFLMETLDVVADESAVKICIAEIISTAGQTGHR